jgi:hypothetical protein
MARALNFRLGEQTAALEIGAKVDKRSLYGFAKRIAEKDGVQLSRGVLLPDGRLLPTQALSWVRVDPEGSPVGKVETVIDGHPVEMLESSFDVDNPLEEAALSELAQFQVQDVYPLSGEGLPEGLYRTEFSYRKSPQRKDALLLVRPNQTFLLVGLQKASTFLDLSVSYEFFDAEAEAEDGDELDFSMI